MNKTERAEIKAIILAQIDALIEALSNEGDDPGKMLRLERLETALKRIDCEHFGECFKCGAPIPMSQLRTRPETIICADCLAED